MKRVIQGLLVATVLFLLPAAAMARPYGHGGGGWHGGYGGAGGGWHGGYRWQGGPGWTARVAPPIARWEVRPRIPAPGYAWAPGYWGWNGGAYGWVDGYWMAPNPGYTWEPAHWVRWGYSWRFVPGHWC
jgi:hypothetical protein